VAVGEGVGALSALALRRTETEVLAPRGGLASC
jgi:hypothetical protein